MKIHRKTWFPFLSAAALIAVDQSLKAYAVGYLRLMERIELLGQDILLLTRVSNKGMAFGRQFDLPYDRLPVLTRDVPSLIWAALALAVAIRFKAAGQAERIGSALLLAGGASNLYGYWMTDRVVDTFKIWIGGRMYLPFNLADLAILGGGAVLAAALLRELFAEDSKEERFARLFG